MSSLVTATAPTASTARAASARPSQRRRNPRGMGRHLADEIVEGALRLIDDGASVDTLTLRAVAREVGISAPSIYAHYRDIEEIVLALVTRIFEEIHVEVAAARHASGADPAERLLAGCRAYVTFGLEHPERYRAIFSCNLDKPDEAEPPTLAEFAEGQSCFVGAEAFTELVRSIEDCARAGCSDSRDPVADAVAVWVHLHGLVSLRNGLTLFPWPPLAEMVDEGVTRVARLRRPA